ncbi:MAG: hypothetical protein ABIH26_02000 [Candidatus Eisenbacteria bacterium]
MTSKSGQRRGSNTGETDSFDLAVDLFAHIVWQMHLEKWRRREGGGSKREKREEVE